MNRSLLQKYWDTNIDPANLGRTPEGLDIEQEIKFYLSPEQRWVYSQTGNLTNRLVLELGGGIGVNAIILARKGAKVVVIDLSLNRLKFLSRLLKRVGLRGDVHLVCSTAEALAVKNDLFDLVYTKSVLIHTELSQALSEIKRVLKHSGEGIFCEPQVSNPLTWLYRQILAPAIWKDITRYFNGKSIRQIKELFPATQENHFYLFAFLAFFWQYGMRNLSLFRFWVTLLNSVDSWLLRISPFLRPLAWFCIVRVKK